MSELQVALTFDAEHPSREGYDSGAEEAILKALTRGGVRATFFVQGRWAAAHPDIARRIVADGHLVGNHSHYHAPMSLLSEEGMRIDVTKSEHRIVDILGVDPKPWFRCPFGDGADQPRVLDALAAMGYRNVNWDIDTEDWCEERSPSDVHHAAVGAAQAGGSRAVLLFHTWAASTASELPRIIADLRAAGASFTTTAEGVDGS